MARLHALKLKSRPIILCGLLLALTPLCPAFPSGTAELHAQSDFDDFEGDSFEDELVVDAPIQLEENPLNSIGNDLDQLIERRMAEDVWNEMLGDLPCGDATVECINQLQNQAINSSRLLSEIDFRIEEAELKIDDARARNQKAIAFDTLSPILRYYLSSDSAQSVAFSAMNIQKIYSIYFDRNRISFIV